jgi:hypothetical protein
VHARIANGRHLDMAEPLSAKGVRAKGREEEIRFDTFGLKYA